MEAIINFLRLELKQRAYYVGTFFWALAMLFGELGKAKKDAIDSGMASQDSFAAAGYSLFGLLFFGLAFIFLFSVLHEIRRSFARHQPSLWNFGLSFTWMSIKVIALTSLTLIPSVVYAVMNYMTSITNPIRYAGTTLALIFIFVPVWFFLYHGATALVMARGHSRRTIRDSWKAFRAIWAPCLLVLLLLLLPSLLVVPFRLLSFKYPALAYVAMGLSVCLAPYQFGIMAATYAYLGKTLIERAPHLMQAETSAS